ncbi:MAG: glycosyltransferase family 4 protein [Chitinophagaceae bacterium]|nr:glycosyltransferase family 4 protein [Chitinophagaceae bacterium]
MNTNRLRIFTWHIHGSYLYYLSRGNFDIYIPVNSDRTDRNIGRGKTFPFGSNVIETDVSDIKNIDIDCIVFQTPENYLTDQYRLFSEEQRKLPKIYIEHDPPRQHPTDTRHVVNDPEVAIVHVTHFNRLMWDSNGLETFVIEHGVIDPGIEYKGDIEKGIVVINNLPARGRLLGLDIFMEMRKYVPLDLVGMDTEGIGLGEVLHPQIPEFTSRYRFFLNPIRYTSFGLAVCEAMMIGLPVVGMATTEMPVVFRNGINGIIHTDIDYLINQMKRLLDDKDYATRIGMEGQKTVRLKYNIERFTADWEKLFHKVIKTRTYEQADSIYQ